MLLLVCLFKCVKLLLVLKLPTFRKADQKYLGSSEMWYWRRMEKISWADYLRNEEVLQ